MHFKESISKMSHSYYFGDLVKSKKLETVLVDKKTIRIL